MCGIAGFAGLRHNPERSGKFLRSMASAMVHRGPDDDGFFVAPEIGLAVKRLSIIDLVGGGQPIFSPDRSKVIVCNGEIYNYRELRKSLEERGHTFSTQSDTEVILRAYEERGPECLHDLQGMFAIAIYEIPSKRLFLARDRVGVKPLYYWLDEGKLAFASEIKSLLKVPGIEKRVNPEAIDLYLSYRYVPGPATLFERIHKFPPGHYAIFEKGVLTPTRYWSPPVFQDAYVEDDHYYQGRFGELFEASVRKRMVSDVPVGAFLSGGIDSSAVVAAMAKHAPSPIRTFSIGFEWEGDELDDARRVAEHLRCEHEEIVCRSSDMELLPKIVWHLDEPVGDAIVLPLYLLSRRAREQVKVVLTGEGADEILAGYFPNKVLWWSHRYSRLIPRTLQRELVQRLVSAAPSSALDLLFDYPADLGDRGKRKLLEYLRRVEEGRLYPKYEALISLFSEKDKRELYAREMNERLGGGGGGQFPDYPFGRGNSELDDILSLQYVHWLPDFILNKQDKMSMANGMEGREPFLDQRLIDFLSTVPPRLKLRGGANKILLRNYLKKILPQEVSSRKKKAFYVPLEKYLGSPRMTEMLDHCLSDELVKKRGYFNPERVRTLRIAAMKGEFVFDRQIFSLLMLELWHQAFLD